MAQMEITAADANLMLLLRMLRFVQLVADDSSKKHLVNSFALRPLWKHKLEERHACRTKEIREEQVPRHPL
jgi:hypothetical protein